MKRAVYVIMLLLTIGVFSQDTLSKKTPIIYEELLLGTTRELNSETNLSYGGTLNYQYKKNLFTARYLEYPRFKVSILFPLLPIPIINLTNNNTKIAALYGIFIIVNGIISAFPQFMIGALTKHID